MNYTKNRILLVLIMLFNGCSLVQENDKSFKFKYYQSTQTTNFSVLAQDLTEGLESELAKLDKRNPIYVVDFVNLKNLVNSSQLGFILSEEIKTQISQKLDIPIISIEYMKYLKLGDSGSRFLARDLKEVNNTKINKNTYALVGTYAFTQRQLILYLKLIDLNNGVILKSSTRARNLTDEILDFESNKQQPKQPKIYKPIIL
jgi:TolB-like protein